VYPEPDIETLCKFLRSSAQEFQRVIALKDKKLQAELTIQKGGEDLEKLRGEIDDFNDDFWNQEKIRDELQRVKGELSALKSSLEDGADAATVRLSDENSQLKEELLSLREETVLKAFRMLQNSREGRNSTRGTPCPTPPGSNGRKRQIRPGTPCPRDSAAENFLVPVGMPPSMVGQVQELEDQNSELKSDMEMMKKRAEGAEEMLELLENEIKALRAEEARRREGGDSYVLDEAESRCRMAERNQEDLRTQLRQAIEETSTLRRERDELREQMAIPDSTAAMQDLEAELWDARNKYETRTRGLQAEVKEAEERARRAEKRIEEERFKVAETTVGGSAKIEEMQADHDRTVSKMEEKIKAKTSELQKLKDADSKWREKLSAKDKQVRSAEKQVHDLEKEVERQKQRKMEIYNRWMEAEKLCLAKADAAPDMDMNTKKPEKDRDLRRAMSAPRGDRHDRDRQDRHERQDRAERNDRHERAEGKSRKTNKRKSVRNPLSDDEGDHHRAHRERNYLTEPTPVVPAVRMPSPDHVPMNDYNYATNDYNYEAEEPPRHVSHRREHSKSDARRREREASPRERRERSKSDVRQREREARRERSKSDARRREKYGSPRRERSKSDARRREKYGSPRRERSKSDARRREREASPRVTKRRREEEEEYPAPKSRRPLAPADTNVTSYGLKKPLQGARLVLSQGNHVKRPHALVDDDDDGVPTPLPAPEIPCSAGQAPPPPLPASMFVDDDEDE